MRILKIKIKQTKEILFAALQDGVAKSKDGRTFMRSQYAILQQRETNGKS